MVKPIDRSDDRVTFLKDDPEVVDEIVDAGTDLHIEKMDDTSYWMRVGQRVFWISSKKRGRVTITEQK